MPWIADRRRCAIVTGWSPWRCSVPSATRRRSAPASSGGSTPAGRARRSPSSRRRRPTACRARRSCSTPAVADGTRAPTARRPGGAGGHRGARVPGLRPRAAGQGDDRRQAAGAHGAHPGGRARRARPGVARHAVLRDGARRRPGAARRHALHVRVVGARRHRRRSATCCAARASRCSPTSTPSTTPPTRFAYLDVDRPGSTAMRRQLADQAAYYEWAREGLRVPLIERTFAWLEEHLPADEGDPVLCWGDARIGNILYDPTASSRSPSSTGRWRCSRRARSTWPGSPTCTRSSRTSPRSSSCPGSRTSCAPTTASPTTRPGPGGRCGT